jgi:hypothetical protein
MYLSNRQIFETYFEIILRELKLKGIYHHYEDIEFYSTNPACKFKPRKLITFKVFKTMSGGSITNDIVCDGELMMERLAL